MNCLFFYSSLDHANQKQMLSNPWGRIKFKSHVLQTELGIYYKNMRYRIATSLATQPYP